MLPERGPRPRGKVSQTAGANGQVLTSREGCGTPDRRILGAVMCPARRNSPPKSYSVGVMTGTKPGNLETDKTSVKLPLSLIGEIPLKRRLLAVCAC